MLPSVEQTAGQLFDGTYALLTYCGSVCCLVRLLHQFVFGASDSQLRVHCTAWVSVMNHHKRMRRIICCMVASTSTAYIPSCRMKPAHIRLYIWRGTSASKKQLPRTTLFETLKAFASETRKEKQRHECLPSQSEILTCRRRDILESRCLPHDRGLECHC